MAQQQVEGPGQRRRGRLVPGEQQRHQLVAQLAVAHPLPSSNSACISIERMSSRSSQVRRCAVLGDLGEEQLVDFAQLGLEAGKHAAAAEAPQRQPEHLAPRRRRFLQDGGEHLPQALEPRPAGDAEDDPQDHLQRHRLHPRVDRELGRRAARSRSRPSTISSIVSS